MKESKGTIQMAGENMEVLIDIGCIRQCKPKVVRALPKISDLLCRTLKRHDVARHFIQDIRIGDTIALVDRQTGYTFRLKIQAHSVCVLGIFERQECPKDAAQQTVFLLRNRLLWAVAGKAVA